MLWHFTSRVAGADLFTPGVVLAAISQSCVGHDEELFLSYLFVKLSHRINVLSDSNDELSCV